MKPTIKACLDCLKHLPGVYLMHNENKQIIYIGKAKDLQKRVSQYFLRPQVGKVAKMAMEAEYFETIITNNEKEALILEMNLIQKHLPKYNILLKDNSHYPYLALKKEGYPYLQIKRNNKDNRYEYYGPFPKSHSAYQTLGLLNRLFPLRKCQNIPKQPCLYYHLGQCLAPCINKIEEKVAQSIKEEVKNFFHDDNQKIINKLKKKMLEASEKLDFEMAKVYKDDIAAIEHINIKQNIENNDHQDRDIFAYATREGYLSLAILMYRKGILLDKKSYIVEQFDYNEEQVADLILQFYQHVDLPHEIIINNETVISILKDYLDCPIYSVSKGKYMDVLLSASQNASNSLDQYFSSSQIDRDKLELLEYLASLLKIKLPLTIDLFDNSHLQGSSPVGASVTFINGEPAKNKYRKYKIEHDESRDDIASMKEIIFRRYTRMINEKNQLPDLILVDGGLLQIQAAKEIINQLQINIPVFGLVKNNKHQTSALMDEEGKTYHIDNQQLFFLLTRMQDEVHRFAISFHQSLRNKKMKSSLLDDIKGLGERRKEMINKAYPDINLLKMASMDELKQLLPNEVATLLYAKLHE